MVAGISNGLGGAHLYQSRPEVNAPGRTDLDWMALSARRILREYFTLAGSSDQSTTAACSAERLLSRKKEHTRVTWHNGETEVLGFLASSFILIIEIYLCQNLGEPRKTNCWVRSRGKMDVTPYV